MLQAWFFLIFSRQPLDLHAACWPKHPNGGRSLFLEKKTFFFPYLCACVFIMTFQILKSVCLTNFPATYPSQTSFHLQILRPKALRLLRIVSPTNPRRLHWNFGQNAVGVDAYGPWTTSRDPQDLVVQGNEELLLLEEIRLTTWGVKTPRKSWDIYDISWCGISSINSTKLCHWQKPTSRFFIRCRISSIHSRKLIDVWVNRQSAINKIPFMCLHDFGWIMYAFYLFLKCDLKQINIII